MDGDAQVFHTLAWFVGTACVPRVDYALAPGRPILGGRGAVYDWFPEDWRGRVGTIDNEPRTRASGWQIAGVWIAAAALLVSVFRAVVDLWPLWH